MAAPPTSSPTAAASTSEEAGKAYKELETRDLHDVPRQIQMAKDVSKNIAGYQEQPTRWELTVWYIYDLCSHFIPAVLLPLVFPLLLSQIAPSPPHSSSPCSHSTTTIYERLIHPSFSIGSTTGLHFSPLHWASISWAMGVLLAGPILAWVAFYLDHGQLQQLISAAAVAVGALFCLPTGSLRSPWPFLLYIAAIAASSTVAAAAHSRHLGLLVRGFLGPVLRRSQFPTRGAIASWLSLYGAAAGSLGAAVMATFTFVMLRRPDRVTSLWVVSIFSGLKWLVGVCHAFGFQRTGPLPEAGENARSHGLQVFKYSHATFSLAGAFFSSFATSCIFTGGLLSVVGKMCFRPELILSVWLAYYVTPLISLPLLHPLQILLRSDAMRMQLVAFLLTAATSGTGFFYQSRHWHVGHVLAGAAVQSTAAGMLQAYGRVLLMDCAPPGKEGSFAAWLAWVRAAGTCGGFALASALPGNVAKVFSVAFCAAVMGMVVLILGNVSHFAGAVAAGHVIDGRSERGSPAQALDSAELGGIVHAEVLEEGKVQL